jgi:hypothetical protein
MSEESRCVICGKPMDEGDKVATVHTGTFKQGPLESGKVWGSAHLKCFYRAMPAPKAALDAIRELSRNRAA